MILPTLPLPTDLATFEEWLEYLLLEHATDITLDVRPHGKNRRRYELRGQGYAHVTSSADDLVLMLDAVPVTHLDDPHVDIQAATVFPRGIDLYDILRRRAGESYGIKLPRFEVSAATLQLSVYDPDSDAENPGHLPSWIADRHRIIDRARRVLPPIIVSTAAHSTASLVSASPDVPLEHDLTPRERYEEIVRQARDRAVLNGQRVDALPPADTNGTVIAEWFLAYRHHIQTSLEKYSLELDIPTRTVRHWWDDYRKMHNIPSLQTLARWRRGKP